MGPRLPGLRNNFADDAAAGCRREKVAHLQQRIERHQFGRVGVRHDRRPFLRQHRQLDQTRRIHAQRVARGKINLGRFPFSTFEEVAKYRVRTESDTIEPFISFSLYGRSLFLSHPSSP